MMSRIGYIYSLIDPRTDEIRYIGRTIEKINKRYSRHIRDARSEDKRHVCNWIRQLLVRDLLPDIRILEECSISEVVSREVFWIAYGKDNGWNLTNITDGGEGLSGYRHSEESRVKIGLSGKGRKLSDEHKEKLRIALTGRVFSTESKAKMSDAQRGNTKKRGKVLSEETRQKIGSANRGKIRSEATRKKLSESHKGQKPACTKLTESDVLDIRNLLDSGNTCRCIADQYGVSKSAIKAIKSRVNWAWLE